MEVEIEMRTTSISRWFVGYVDKVRNASADVRSNVLHQVIVRAVVVARVRKRPHGISDLHWVFRSTATWHFPLSLRQGETDATTDPVIPLIWKFPKCDLYSCSLFPGNLDAKNCTGVIVGFKESTWCWAKYPLQNLSNLTQPTSGRHDSNDSRTCASDHFGLHDPTQDLVLQSISLSYYGDQWAG
jgi:hypothetical protein